jgi:hypothetical protein
MQEAAMFVRRNEQISIEERHMSRSSNLHTLLKSNEKPQANGITRPQSYPSWVREMCFVDFAASPRMLNADFIVGANRVVDWVFRRVFPNDSFR